MAKTVKRNPKSERLDCRTTKTMKRMVDRFVRNEGFNNTSEAINFILGEYFEQQKRLEESNDEVLEELSDIKSTLANLYERLSIVEERYSRLLLQQEEQQDDVVQEEPEELSEEEVEKVKNEIQEAIEQTSATTELVPFRRRPINLKK